MKPDWIIHKIKGISNRDRILISIAILSPFILSFVVLGPKEMYAFYLSSLEGMSAKHANLSFFFYQFLLGIFSLSLTNFPFYMRVVCIATYLFLMNFILMAFNFSLVCSLHKSCL